MANKDTSQLISPAASILPQALTATLNGTGVDLLGFNAATVIFNLGVFAGTSPTATLDIQDSPDNVTFTSVPAASLIGGALPAMNPTNANQMIKRGYMGTQRYLRACVTAIGGTSPSLPISAEVIRELPASAPAASTE